MTFFGKLTSLGAAVGLAACAHGPEAAGVDASGAHPWTQRGVLRIEMTSLPNTLDPVLRTQLAETFVGRFMFDPLVETRPDGTIEAKLARVVPTRQNGGISSDGKTVTYHLRPGVRWHDGTPFTSADVRFTAAAYMDSRNNASIRDGFDRVQRIDTPNPLTAVVHLAAPYTPFVRQFETTGRVVPAHVFASSGALNSAPFNAAPIGTGPFKFERWLRGDRLELVANDAYYLGRPNIRRVVVRFVPNDSTAINALLTHEVDWLWNASPFAYRRLRTVPTLHVAPIAANAVHGLEMNVTQPPLDDARVRRAISYAVDRVALVRNVAFGSTTAADADLPAFMRRGAGAGTGQGYDPSAARASLDRAGWRIVNGERTKGGRALAFTLVYPAGNVTSAAEVVQIQSMLRALGISVVAKAFDPNQLFAPAQMGGVLEGGKFELDLSGYFQTDDPDDSALFSCANRAPRGANVSRYCSRRFETLTAQAIATPDGPKRDALYGQIERTLADDAPWAFVWWPHTLQIYDTDFKNYEVTPGRQSLDPQNWSIGTDLKHR